MARSTPLAKARSCWLQIRDRGFPPERIRPVRNPWDCAWFQCWFDNCEDASMWGPDLELRFRSHSRFTSIPNQRRAGMSRRVLIVEDELIVADDLEWQLTNIGYEVT